MKILLPIDTSDCCKDTLTWAENFLAKSKAKISLLNIVQSSVYVPEVSLMEYEYETEMSENLLKTTKAELENKGFVVVRADYRYGDPAQNICAYADEYGIEQIIIGSHGHRPILDFLMGSVSRDVFQSAQQSVLLINNTKQPSIEISHAEQLNTLQVN